MLSQTLNTDDLFAEPCATDKCFLIVSMFDKKQQLISENWLLAEAPKKVKTFTDAGVKVTSVSGPKLRFDGRNEFDLVVEASAPAPFTWLEAGSVAVSKFNRTKAIRSHNSKQFTTVLVAVSLFFFLRFSKGHFSDNGFFLHAPKRFVSFISSNSSLTHEELAKELSVIQYTRSVDTS